jgi:hypothetical protein
MFGTAPAMLESSQPSHGKDKSWLTLTEESRPVDDKTKDRVLELKTHLESLNENFDREMRARGFDPAQAENVPLPAALAQLYMERQLLLEELNNLEPTDIT